MLKEILKDIPDDKKEAIALVSGIVSIAGVLYFLDNNPVVIGRVSRFVICTLLAVISIIVFRNNENGIIKMSGILLGIIGLAIGVFPFHIPITSIEIELNVIDLSMDESRVIPIHIEPKDANKKGITWTSSKDYIVAVDENGVIHAIEPGFAVVYAEAGEHQASCIVMVENPIKSIEFENDSIELNVGDNYKLQVKVDPQETDEQDIFWKSSDSSIVTVNEHGEINAISKGNATITVEARGLRDTFSVTVENPITSIQLENDNIDLNIGENRELRVVVVPQDADEQVFSWKSSDPNIVTVNENGVITAVGMGSATITVETDTSSDSCFVRVITE